MPTTLLNNICSLIRLVNGARYISVDNNLDDDNIFILQLVDNEANNFSNLFLTRCKYNSM